MTEHVDGAIRVSHTSSPEDELFVSVINMCPLPMAGHFDGGERGKQIEGGLVFGN